MKNLIFEVTQKRGNLNLLEAQKDKEMDILLGLPDNFMMAQLRINSKDSHDNFLHKNYLSIYLEEDVRQDDIDSLKIPELIPIPGEKFRSIMEGTFDELPLELRSDCHEDKNKRMLVSRCMPYVKTGNKCAATFVIRGTIDDPRCLNELHVATKTMSANIIIAQYLKSVPKTKSIDLLQGQINACEETMRINPQNLSQEQFDECKKALADVKAEKNRVILNLPFITVIDTSLEKLVESVENLQTVVWDICDKGHMYPSISRQTIFPIFDYQKKISAALLKCKPVPDHLFDCYSVECCMGNSFLELHPFLWAEG